MTYTGTKAVYISNARYNAAAIWLAGHAYSVGDVVRQSGISVGITIGVGAAALFTWKDNAGTTLAHGFSGYNPAETITFSDNGDTLPTPLAFATPYYTISGGLTTTAFELSTSVGGSAITTGGSPAGTHKATGIHNGNERCYVCTVAGTSAATLEPVWTVARGYAQPSDNGVIWVECTGLAMLNGDATNTPNWTNGSKSTTPSLGHVITDNAGTHVFICTTSAAAATVTEPTWSVGSLGATTTDGSAVWTYIGTVSTWQGKKWAAPHARIQNALTTNWGDVATKFYIGDDHSELGIWTSGAGLSLTGRGTNAAPIDVLCIDHTGSVPPVSADLKTTAVLSCYDTLTVSGGFRICYGITFRVAAESGNINLNANGDAQSKYYKFCNFEALSTGSGILTLNNSDSGFAEYEDCTLKFGGTVAQCAMAGRTLFRRGGIASGGTTPTNLFYNYGRSILKFEGFDFSQLGSTNLFNLGTSPTGIISAWLDACKMPSTYTLASGLYDRGQRVLVTRSNTGTNTAQNKYEVADYAGNMTTDFTAARTSGIMMEGVGLTWKITTITTLSLGAPFISPPFTAYNSATGASVEASVHGIAFAAAAPNNDELWLDVTYPANTNNTMSGVASGRVVDFLAANAVVSIAQTGDAWDGVATARQNSHAYSVGDFIKTSTQAGMLYQCTGAGTSASSEGSLYASATDGSSITDGGATFRGGYRFKLSCQFTPQLAGMVVGSVRAGKISTTYYVEPLLNLA